MMKTTMRTLVSLFAAALFLAACSSPPKAPGWPNDPPRPINAGIPQ
jgi:uncharacterized lipoprotein YajG